MVHNDQNTHLVKSAARTLDILELLGQHPDGLTLTDIGQYLDIPLSSLHSLTATLVHKGFVVRDESSLVYSLGPRLSLLLALYNRTDEVVSLSDPIMTEIRDQTGETVSLTMLYDDMVVFIHKKAGQGLVQVINPVGTQLPAHATGAGKVMLAHLSSDEIDRIYPDDKLSACTAHTITQKNDLKTALNKARACGYAYDAEESAIGVWAVASCIRDASGHPAAGLSIVSPLFRVQQKEPHNWHELVLDGAARVSAQLGFLHNSGSSVDDTATQTSKE